METATKTTKVATKKPKIKLDFKDSKYATGRRKKSIAKIWVKKGTGKIYVNGRTMDEYFTSGSHKMQITRPFEIINQATVMMLDVVLLVVVIQVKLVQWYMVLLKH